MDVKTINQASISLTLAAGKTTKSTSANATGKAGITEESAAFSLEITSSTTTEKTTDTKEAATGDTKGLTTEQVGILKDGIAASQALMIKVMTQQNVKLQGYLDGLVGKLNFDGVLIDTSEFALPEVATTPEEAQKAISDGGAYSISAVADRIFGMASKIANGDPAKLEQMRAAVEKGFALAGTEFSSATGADGLPQISKDTHTEIMKRFDDLQAKLSGKTTPDDTAQVQKQDA